MKEYRSIMEIGFLSEKIRFRIYGRRRSIMLIYIAMLSKLYYEKIIGAERSYDR